MSGPNGDPDFSMDDGIINDEDEFGDGEYVAINSMLDQINSYLDDIEERNDSLNGKLHELLESNRQARQEFRAQAQLSSQAQEEQEEQQQQQQLPTDGKEELEEDTLGDKSE